MSEGEAEKKSITGMLTSLHATLRLLRTSTKMFSNLASQSAQLSVSPSALYPTAQPEPETVADVMSRGIKFTSTTDDEGKDDLEALRREIFGGSDQP